MRILLLCKDMDCGGAQTHVLELASGLARLGHEVCVASSGGALTEELSARGVRCVIMPDERRNAVSVLRLRRAIKRLICEGFDVVHAHTRISAMLAFGICRARKICFVTTVHAHFKMNAFLRRVCRWGQSQIAVSRDLYFYLLENAPSVNSRSICVINNGIDIRKFSPENLNKDGKKDLLNVLFLSRLDKNCSALAYSLCRIAERLFKISPQIHIIIGGGGSEFEAVRGLAQEVNKRLGARVIDTVGRVDNALEFLSRGDIFIGVSRAALEAMACGIPTIVGGDEGFLGIADGENLKRGEYSNFCCRGERAVTDETLFESVLQLVKMSVEERSALGERACEYVRKHHSAEKMVQKTVDFYKRSLCLSKSCPKGKKRRGVLLCGYYGFGNMGDELMLEAAVRRAERECGAERSEIKILSRSRKIPSYLQGVRLVRRSSPMAVIHAINSADRVIFGGGTLLQNQTSYRSLAYYLAILRYAQLRGKRTELWGNGIGKIKGERSRRAVAKALCACNYVGLRDGVSMARVRLMCRDHELDAPEVVAERDPALEGWLYRDSAARESDVFVRLGIAKGSKVAVFALCGRASPKYQRCIFEYAKELSKNGVLPIFIVMYPAQDLSISRRFAERLGGVLAYPFGAEDIVALMRCAEAVYSMRYHALLLAYVAGVNFVCFGDDEKLRSFCAEYGGEHFESKKTDRS